MHKFISSHVIAPRLHSYLILLRSPSAKCMCIVCYYPCYPIPIAFRNDRSLTTSALTNPCGTVITAKPSNTKTQKSCVSAAGWHTTSARGGPPAPQIIYPCYHLFYMDWYQFHDTFDIHPFWRLIREPDALVSNFNGLNISADIMIFGWILIRIFLTFMKILFVLTHNREEYRHIKSNLLQWK